MVDITGLIGQYAHGNEPSHHVAYLYNFVGRPDKTQMRVRQILREMYSSRPDGLVGNEDCGQMSAWYVLSAMGIYPLNPVSGEYQLGSPIFKRVVVDVGHSRTFEILAPRTNRTNVLVESVSLNGKPLTRTYITHAEIVAGGVLEFHMKT
jgi:predicted alpha-1,2-mannosidase